MAVDVGDWRAPTLTVSPYDGTTSATLVVEAPSGTTTTLTPTTATGGATWTAPGYQLSQAGQWIEHWTVTGTGAGAEHLRVNVAPTPTPVPAALATIADLEKELGRSLTATETAKAPGLLASASARIRGFCRRQLTAVANDTVVLRPVGSLLRLPCTPVTAVDQVAMVGTAGTVDRVMTATEWAWDGIDTIELWPDPYRQDWPTASGTYADTYRVTYDHGAGTVPEYIVSKTVEIVLRHLITPSQVAGLVQERIGSYSYGYQQGTGSPGAAVRLSKEDKQDLREAGYRRTAATIQARAG